MSRDRGGVVEIHDLTSLDNNPGAWYVPQGDQPQPPPPPPTREASPEPEIVSCETWVQRISKTTNQKGR